MSTLASILVALVAIEHIYILWIEMFAWTTKGKEVFKGALPDELFEKTQGLAANQGLYNGFLAAGLLWGLFITDPSWSVYIQLFFLSCILVAALFYMEHGARVRVFSSSRVFLPFSLYF